VNRALKLEKARDVLARIDVVAAKHVAKMVRGETPNASETKLSNQDKAALTIVGHLKAHERAQQLSTGPQRLGVIVVHERLEDTPQNRLSWEQQAAELRDARAIEAVPAKEPDGA
jgi:hypothetical protein